MTMVRRTPPEHPTSPEEDQHGTVRDGDGSTRKFTVVGWRPGRKTKAAEPMPTRERVAAAALWVAGIVIVGVIIGGAVVVYDAQYQFAYDHNGEDKNVARIQAAIPDLVWIAMSALGLTQALRGKSSLRATSSIFLFFALSMGAQLLHAEQTPEGYLVAAITPLALALMLEALLHGVRHWALARDGHDDKTTPLIVRIFVGLLKVLVMPLAWLLRLALDPKQTAGGMRDWLLDVTPYAPGRTLAQDRTTQALAQAGSAKEIAARVQDESAAAIAAAKAAAAKQIADAEAAAAEKVKVATEQQTARANDEIAREQGKRERLVQQHADQVKGFNAQIAQLSADLEGVRTDLAQAQTAANQGRRYESDLRNVRRELDQVRRLHSEEQGRVAQQQRELESLFVVLSGRQQVDYLYERLGRQGDPRHGNPERLGEIAEEFLQSGVKVESTATVVRYLRESVSASGPQLASVTGGFNDTMGGGGL